MIKGKSYPHGSAAVRKSPISCAASVLTLAAPSRPPARWRETTLSISSCKALSHKKALRYDMQCMLAQGVNDNACTTTSGVLAIDKVELNSMAIGLLSPLELYDRY